ncbi:MAG: Lsm family RNA-binding protein [Candidatus Kariarchaeaceae archaeon]|jgi:small nuclear ribonucleoprotein (snRNP)-like protein
MSSNLGRAFATELNAFVQKNIVITTKAGNQVVGRLIGMSPDSFSIIVGDALSAGKKHHRIFISGDTIAEMTLGQAPFAMPKLREELEKIFKKSGVRYFDDTRTLVIMDRYRVTEDEVEGEGPVADRIRRVWQVFKEEYESGTIVETDEPEEESSS